MRDNRQAEPVASEAGAGPRIVVAMSGGVDSSVTAALLKAEGYEVIGVTLQLYDHGAATRRAGACCAGEDIHDARRVADRLDIPHYVLDYETRFRQAVIEDFLDGYTRGETPLPCVRCNQRVKFADLLEMARGLGAEALATGHYVRRHEGPEGAELHTAVERGRDQSYFLFATTRQELAFLRFPLGGRPKEEVRALARRFDLPVAAKRDSQDICFVPEGSYAEVLRRLRPEAERPGEIVHLDGRVLGRHEGIFRFTIGQRRGLGLGGERAPLYVVALEPERARVIVGPRAALAGRRVRVKDFNWLGPGSYEGGERPVEVKLRSTQAAVPALLRAPAGGRQAAPGEAEIALARPEYGISPGQAAVVYQGSRVLGGGWITGSDALVAAGP